MYIMRSGGSSIVGPKMSNVPWPTGLLLRCAGVLCNALDAAISPMCRSTT